MAANTRNYKASFNGGELTPEFFGQISDAKFQTGLSLCRNFIVKPQGPVENRAGFGFVRETKNTGITSRLLSFTYSTTQTMIIELGAGYFRFHTMGATQMESAPAWGPLVINVVGRYVTYNGLQYRVTVGNTGVLPTDTGFFVREDAPPYEIPNPYAAVDLFDIHTVQSGDVLTLVHPNYAPRELRRVGLNNWILTTIPFTPTVLPPTTVVATPNVVSATYDYSYVVTSISLDGLTQSVPSNVATCQNNIFAAGGKNTINWAAAVGAVAGVTQYVVYKMVGGVYGYIGRTTTQTLVDDNISPDMSLSPPNYEAVFQAAGDYPSAVTYYEQRRVFGGTLNALAKIWMTRSGTESDMSFSLPVRDDDRVAFRIAAREANTIRHLVPLSDLLALTSSTEFRITAVNTDAITPLSISSKAQSYIGASNVQPCIINNNLVYAAARGGHAREMAYSRDANGYASGDLSLRSIHLFDDFDLVDMAFAKAPIPIVWAISTSGKLLGLTYVPEQQVGAWHQHDTDGVFESCAVVAEGREDVLYVIVRRTIGGVQRRYIERQSTRKFGALADAFFVDSGATYRGVLATVVSGLTWLEGKTVNILADGAVHPRRVVTGGAVTLDNPASVVTVGLPITSDVETLPLAASIDTGYGQGKVKNVNTVWLRVVNSSGIFAGPDTTRLVQFKQRTNEVYGAPPALRTDEIEISVKPDWGNDASIIVRQSDPLPITIVSMTMDVVIAN